MAATRKKKSPPPKRGGTAAPRKALSAEAQAAERQANRQIAAIVLFAVGLLLVALSMIEGDSLWLTLHDSFFGLFGFTAVLIGPLLIYIAIMTTLDKPIGSLGHKAWQTAVLILLICAALLVFSYSNLLEDGLFDMDDRFFTGLGELFAAGTMLEGGGMLSAIFGWPALKLCGPNGLLGAKILILLWLFVAIMIFSGATLIGLYRSAVNPVKKAAATYADRIRERDSAPPPDEPVPIPIPNTKQKPAKRFNVDVPLDLSPPGPPIPDFTEEEPVSQHGSLAKQALLQIEEETPEEEEIPFEDPFDGLIPAPEISPDPPVILPETPTAPALHFRSPPAQKPQSTDDVIDEILKRSAMGKNILAEEEEPIPDPVEVKLAQGIQEAVQERQAVPQPPKRDRFEELIGQPLTYAYPPVTLLQEPEQRSTDNVEDLKMNAQRLVDTLQSFGVQTRIIDIEKGPAVTRYELQPSAGVKISKITSLADDIALNLASAGVRIEAPIPNKPAVGIEVPNRTVATVHIREIIDSDPFVDAKSPLSVALGRDIGGRSTVADIARMPHMLIAGATGSGKSVCINSVIISLLYKSPPDKVKLLMVDPKVVELGIYNGIPHLLVPVVTDPKKAAGALAWAVSEMLGRYRQFADNSVRDITGFNRLCTTHKDLRPMPQIVIIIDELADLMMAAPNEVEDYICRLAQMARAAGMHLVIATQRPSVNVITGVIKANIPSRIAFAVSSAVDSRTILDMGGAEKLLGRGDMLFYPVGMPKPLRVQGCFVSDEEVERVVEFVKQQGRENEYDQEVMQEIERQAITEKDSRDDDGGGFAEEDDMLPAAIECVVEMGVASTSMLQRRLKLGYARAARIVDQLEAKGIVGPLEGSKPRQVLISREQWYEMKLNNSN